MKNKHNPKCPHCEYVFDDEETWYGEYTVGKIYTGDGDESTITCPNLDCKKSFTVTCTHELVFESEDAPEDE